MGCAGETLGARTPDSPSWLPAPLSGDGVDKGREPSMKVEGAPGVA